jgi:hypothetical protein
MAPRAVLASSLRSVTPGLFRQTENPLLIPDRITNPKRDPSKAADLQVMSKCLGKAMTVRAIRAT